VFDYKNQHLGSGFYNKNSLISVRLFSPIFKNDLKEYFISSLSNAFNFRKAVYPARDSFRMVYSESDFLPGLIIDKYNDTFVLQVYCFGIQKNIELILDILKEQFNAKNIFTKHDFYFRKLEGLPEKDELYSEEIHDIIPRAIIAPVNFYYGIEGRAETWQTYGNWFYTLNKDLLKLPEEEIKIFIEIDPRQSKGALKLAQKYFNYDKMTLVMVGDKKLLEKQKKVLDSKIKNR